MREHVISGRLCKTAKYGNFAGLCQTLNDTSVLGVHAARIILEDRFSAVGLGGSRQHGGDRTILSENRGADGPNA